MSVKRTLLSSTVIAGTAIFSASLFTPALAQETATAASQPQAGQASNQEPDVDPLAVDQDAEVEAVVVTGTRLRLPDYALPNPVVSLDSETIEFSGATNVTDFLQDVPSLLGSVDSELGADTTTPGLVGLNLLNLRNLGSDRTLVLVNGRRHVASNPGTAAVDVNTIPTALIERVEVLTGGASAVYGADGVSGVVNFILKRDFEGVDFRVQKGWSDEGGGGNEFVSGLVGHNFMDKRGNVTFGLEYDSSEPLKFSEREFSRIGNRLISISNPDDPGTFDADEDDPNIPDNILARDVRYIDTSPGGSIYSNFNTSPNTSGVSFLNDGSPFVDGIYAGEFFMIGGSGSPLDAFNDDLLPGLDRATLSSTGRFEVAPGHSLFGELKYTRTETAFTAQPSYDYGLFIALDNPFIPANVRADALAPGGLGLSDGGVYLARDNFDLGSQQYDVERNTLRAVAGVEGDLTDNIEYEISYTYGKAEESQLASNVRINERFFAATDVIRDASGTLRCRSDLDPTAVPVGDVFAQFAFDPSTFGTTFTPGPNSGCTPVNILAGDGQVFTPEALAWINTTAEQEAEIDQSVLTAFLTGNTEGFFTLPGGPVSFVVGGEYRKETSDFRPSRLALLADELDYSAFTTAGRAVRTKGEFDVKEAFVEASLPLLKDIRFIDDLTVSGAFRYSDYSTTGESETWNVGGQWRITPDLMLRGTRARAVRAPNIVNLFEGRQQTFGTFADPCSASNLNSGENPALRRTNCAAALTALGVADPSTFINNSSEAVGGFRTGNPDLEPEEADTVTLGVVVTPRFIRGLSLSVDWYDIEIDKAIQSFASQTIVNNCYDLPQPNQFCDLVTRGTSGGNLGRITSFLQVPGNIALYKTAGYDFTARYRLNPEDLGIKADIGTFRFSLIGNYLDELTFVEASGAEPDSDVGEGGAGVAAPEWQATFDATWLYKSLTVNYGFNYFSETSRVNQTTIDTQPDFYANRDLFYYEPRKSHDLQVRYAVNGGLEVYGGVNNFTNQEPSFSSYDFPVSSIGRFFYVGFSAKLDSLGRALSGF